MKTYVGPRNCTRTSMQCSFKGKTKKKKNKHFVYLNNSSITPIYILSTTL